MTWDDFYRSQGKAGPEPATPKRALARHELPADIRAMLDDPERPRARAAGEAYAIAEYIIGRSEWGRHSTDPGATGPDGKWHRFPDEQIAANERWRRSQMLAVGVTLDELSAGDLGTAVYYAVLAAVREDVAPRTGGRADDPTIASELPDEGATIEEIVEALGVSRRTIETRLAAEVATGITRFEEEPTGRGGKPRKRYFRVEASAT